MSRIRLIPRLDVKGPNLIKGIHLEGLRVIGDPHEHAVRYYEQGADELLFMDVVASLRSQWWRSRNSYKSRRRLVVPRGRP